MFWNKIKVISLKKKKSGKIILGNSSSANVLGKGNVVLGIKNRKEAIVLLVDGLNDKILSVGLLWTYLGTTTPNSYVLKLRDP